jgi:hypothetical protein
VQVHDMHLNGPPKSGPKASQVRSFLLPFIFATNPGVIHV